MNADIYRAGSNPSAFSHPASFLPRADKVAVLTANPKPQREFCGFCFDRRKYFEQKRI